MTYPKLQWLDIDIDSSMEMDLIHSSSLFVIPIAMPSLQKVCFSGIFKSTDPELCSDDDSDSEDSCACSQISPYTLKDFCTAFKTPLNSLSLNGPDWMTDDHVEEIMPIIGKNLTCLEFIRCRKYEYSEVEQYIFQRLRTNLSDSSLFSIARHCNNLESLSIVESDITSVGLEKVLSANPKITTLNLADNYQLDAETINVISRCVPKLKILRNGGDGYDTWLTDTTLKALVDAQLKASGDSCISLERIGVYSKRAFARRRLTIGGIKYAISKGLKEIEMVENSFSRSILASKLNVKLIKVNSGHCIAGSMSEYTLLE